MKIIYDQSKLENHPAFNGLKTLLNQESLEPMNYLDYFSRDPTDICTLLIPMYNLAKDIGAKTIVELGVRWGNSTVALLVHCHYNDAHLYSIDIEDCHVARSIINALGLAQYWTFAQCNDVDYIKKWKIKDDNTIDLLFIDTDHTYDLTKKELEEYSPYIRKGGVILFHDSYMEGVKGGYTDFLAKYTNWTSLDDSIYLPLGAKAIKKME